MELNIFSPPNRRHSALVSINVLEHIPDHVAALAAAHQLIKPGGAVITFAPAFEFALSKFDESVGHVRRYTKATLAAAYRSAGLAIERIHYVNAPGPWPGSSERSSSDSRQWTELGSGRGTGLSSQWRAESRIDGRHPSANPCSPLAACRPHRLSR